MIRYPALFILIIFCATNFSFAQAPAMVWQKCLGGNNGDYANSVEPTADGGYIVAGYTEGKDNGDVMGYHGNLSVGDIWVVKTDNIGNIQWQKCVGGSSFETGAYIHQTPDGGYILAGTSASVNCNFTGNHGGSDYLVVKLNSKGDVVWKKMYGGSKNEYAWYLSLAPDGGYIVTGETESNNGDITVNHGMRDYWVIKLDVSGNLIWQKSLGGTNDDESYSVQATADGGCIVAGYTTSNDGDVSGVHGKWDYWVVKLDNTGTIQWQKALGGSEFDIAWSVQVTTDGGYIVAGSSGSNNGDVSGNHNGFGPGDADFWVVKLSSTGSIQWQKCYGGNLNEIAYYIQPTQDGGYVIAGTSESADGDVPCNAGITDAWIVKINSTGALQWQKQLGGILYDEPHCVKELADGTFIVAGNTCSKNISGYHIPTNLGSCADFWLIKLSAPVAVSPNPVITINPASTNVCGGIPATITSSVQYAGLNPTYQWTKNGVPVGGNSSSLTASNFANNDLITCTVTGGGTPCESFSAQATDAATITVNNNTITPQVSISADNTFICNCTTITFKAAVTNMGASPVYQWKVNGVLEGNNTNQFITNLLNPGDVVTCVYSDNTSCVAGGSVISNSVQINAGTNNTPSISITADAQTTCAGSAVTFTASPVNAGANPGYQWKINGANAGINDPVFSSSSLVNGDLVSCEITADPSFACTTGNAFSNNIVMNISGAGIPSLSISASATTICLGAAVTFTASPINAGANPVYQWKINGVNAGLNNKVFTTSSLVNGDLVSCAITTDPLYTCSIGNSAGSNTIPINVTATSIPTANITSDVNDVCAGAPIVFSVVSQNAGASPSYQWYLNNSPLNNISPVFTSTSLSNGDAIYCSVSPVNVTCSSSPVSSNTIVAVIRDLPQITIQPADTLIKTGQKVQLNAVVTGIIGSYQWSPSDQLENPLTLDPFTIPLINNTTYSLMVVSDKGCEATATAIVKVGRPLAMPNAFTPNGDGRNDIFRIPEGVTLQLQEFSIFDRWGEKIFSTHNISEGWNGTIHGEPADTGTYVYFINGTNEKGNVFLKGTIVLLR